MTVPPSMPCQEARETLASVRHPVLLVGPVAQAREHVEGCHECQRFLDGDPIAALAAEHSAGREKAPAALRDRVLATLALEELLPGRRTASAHHATPWRSSAGARWIAAAVVAVLTVSVVAARADRTPPVPATSTAFVDDYLRRAVGQERIETSDPMRIGGWLTRELGMPLRPIAAHGLELESAEICLLDGQRGAMIQYRIDGVPVAHYLVPRAGVGARPPAPGIDGAPGDTVTPPMVTWSTASLEQALVGEISTEMLLFLARSSH